MIIIPCWDSECNTVFKHGNNRLKNPQIQWEVYIVTIYADNSMLDKKEPAIFRTVWYGFLVGSVSWGSEAPYCFPNKEYSYGSKVINGVVVQVQLTLDLWAYRIGTFLVLKCINILFIHLSKCIIGLHLLGSYMYLKGKVQGLWLRTFIIGKVSWKTLKILSGPK